MMKKRKLFITGMMSLLSICVLSGCGTAQEETAKVPITIALLEEPIKIQSEIPTTENSGRSATELIDAFLAGEIPANYVGEDGEAFYITELPMDPEDALSYSVGDRVDLDNDGETELIINGAYGGIYLDGRDGKIYVLDQGEGTIATISYTSYEGKNWIVHSDTTHSGRVMYDFTLYDGTGQVVDQFNLNKEYRETPDEPDGPGTVYTYRDIQISKEEYDELIMKIFG